MLDVHMIVSSTTKKEWADQALDSVAEAIEACPYKVNFYVVDGVEGHIGQGRQAGYDKGSARYMTYVDDDDYVEPEMFACLEPVLQKNFAAIFTGETLLQNGVFSKSPERHHLAIYRRDTLEGFDLTEWVACGDVATKYLVETHPDGTVYIPTHHYIHRIYPDSGARKLRRIFREELRRARWQTY